MDESDLLERILRYQRAIDEAVTAIEIMEGVSIATAMRRLEERPSNRPDVFDHDIERMQKCEHINGYVYGMFDICQSCGMVTERAP